MTPTLTQTSCPRPARQRRLTLWARVLRWADLGRQRRALGDLDPHLLCDIGLTQQEARTEAARAPWDAPEHWHQ